MKPSQRTTCTLALAGGLCGLACLGLTGKLTSAPAADATDVAAKNHVVEIKDFMFQPATLAVPAGTKVRFVNRDEEPHTVASRDGKFAKSEALDTGGEFSLTLTTPGEYAYFCTVHPHMTGTITVSPAAPAPTPAVPAAAAAAQP